MKNITDTDRLNWVITNKAIVYAEGLDSANPYYFIIYCNGATGDSYPDPRKAIDAELKGL